jgi:hypothetical protein
MEKFAMVLLLVLGVLAVAAMYALFLGWLVMLCWNYLAPVLSLPVLGWWQSCVLTFLCGLLFKNSDVRSSSND